MKHISIVLLSLLALMSGACSSHRSAIVAPADMSRELKAAGINVEGLDAKEGDKWLTALAKTYTSWERMTLDGSLSIKQLPLDPSVKIYMERGKLIILSLRVPLFGEVGRVEIDAQNTLIVNRRGKCYTEMPTARLLNRLGVSLTDFQDLLLGRVFLAGSASLAADNVALFSVSEAAGGTYIVTPRKQRDDAEYGFTLYPDGKMLLAVAFTTDEVYLLQSRYSYSKDETSLGIDITAGKKSYSGTLTYGKPDMKPKQLDRVEINPKWSNVTLRKLFTSF